MAPFSGSPQESLRHNWPLRFYKMMSQSRSLSMMTPPETRVPRVRLHRLGSWKFDSPGFAADESMSQYPKQMPGWQWFRNSLLVCNEYIYTVYIYMCVYIYTHIYIYIYNVVWSCFDQVGLFRWNGDVEGRAEKSWQVGRRPEGSGWSVLLLIGKYWELVAVCARVSPWKLTGALWNLSAAAKSSDRWLIFVGPLLFFIGRGSLRRIQPGHWMHVKPSSLPRGAVQRCCNAVATAATLFDVFCRVKNGCLNSMIRVRSKPSLFSFF